jgi:hypothetical protein
MTNPHNPRGKGCNYTLGAYKVFIESVVEEKFKTGLL